MASKENQTSDRREWEPRRETSYKIKLGLVIFGMVLMLFLIRFFSKNASKIPEKINDTVEQVFVGTEGKVTTFSKADIEKVFEISELSTADYTYNAIAKAYTEDGTSIRYYVAYEGTIKAGIDFSEIAIEVDEEAQRITITLPKVELKEKTVDPGTFEYIFKDKKSETETVHQEAFRLCEEDLKRRADSEQELLKLAKENAVAVVKALVTPWIEQINEEYQIVIR